MEVDRVSQVELVGKVDVDREAIDHFSAIRLNGDVILWQVTSYLLEVFLQDTGRTVEGLSQLV